ncbi:MAG: hypothetical protein FWF28_02705 [Micrococcales bacterium]|nr:hypothetical protein [Micrococcales bacterium]
MPARQTEKGKGGVMADDSNYPIAEDPEEPSRHPRSPEPGGSRQRKPWFRKNRAGAGFHPADWRGWLLIVVIIAAIVLIRLAVAGKL